MGMLECLNKGKGPWWSIKKSKGYSGARKGSSGRKRQNSANVLHECLEGEVEGGSWPWRNFSTRSCKSI